MADAVQIETTEMVHEEIGWKPDQNLMVLRPAMELEVALQRVREFQKIVKKYFIKEVDYGTIPGTEKPTLYKSGADKFCDIYGLTDTYEIIYAERDWASGLFAYEIRCLLHYRGTSVLVSTGLGSCSTWEGKFRWRTAKRRCPECGMETVIKGKKEWGGGWICHKKQGGCGEKFTEHDGHITSQEVGRITNPDIHDQINNVLKSGKKRAKVDAVLAATRSSGLFTQDMEEMPPDEQDEPYGFTVSGQLTDFKTRPNGLALIKVEKDGKAWVVIAHDETALFADRMLGAYGETEAKIEVELDCIESKAPNGTKYNKLLRIVKKQGMVVADEAFTNEGQLMSKCLTHGLYQGEGNCPKCENPDFK